MNLPLFLRKAVAAMKETCVIASPVGRISIESDTEGVTAISFVDDEVAVTSLEKIQSSILKEALNWLEKYFSGKDPGTFQAIHLVGTPFQMQVWNILCAIPYGTTMTYGEIAHKISESRGGVPMAAQAVGGAVGKNPVAIIVPCHRVIGAKGKLTGYAAGLDKKIALLKQEGVVLTSDAYISTK